MSTGKSSIRKARGPKSVQMWLPDTRTAEFAAQAHRDSLAIANSPTEQEDQAFIDSDATLSVTICPLTGTPVDNVYGRFAIAPAEANGLQVSSHAMVDKISTVPKSKVGQRIGELEADHVALLNERVILFLGLAK